MPYGDVSQLPSAFKNQSSRVKRKGLEILNALLADGETDEGKAIRIALSRAQKWAKSQTPKAGGPMEEATEMRLDDASGRLFVDFTATTRFFKGWTDDPTDQTLCFETRAVTDNVDKDVQWFSEKCMKALANDGDVPLLVGDSHQAAMINATSKVGMAIEHEVIYEDGATILVAKGQFSANHPDAARLWNEAQLHPEEYATSIGGWVKPEWIEMDAVHKSGKRGMRIDRMDRDHCLFCRASAARNPHTTFAAVVGKALGTKMDVPEPDAAEDVEKAWAGHSDRQVRRAVEDKLTEIKSGDNADAISGWPFVAELYENFAIVQGLNGTYYKLTLSARKGNLVIGDPQEVKRTYADKCWVDEHYPAHDADNAHAARTRVMRRQIGWDVALPVVHKAFQELNLAWDSDASGEAIDPAVLAEEEEVLKAAEEAALGNSMATTTEEKRSIWKRLGEALNIIDDEATEKAGETTTEEPQSTEMIDAMQEAMAAGFKVIGDQMEAAIAKATK
ncbi:hypothetical protein LCGC14_1560930 [marine sediment metagenome]|uniref:Uncharacterized protein n=1 Tax=marine sediment metagenome TaxID=412755 RepID=A0A0F9J8J2_9ZZZZ